MSTTAKVGGTALWKGDSRRFWSGQQGLDYCFMGQLIPAKITALRGTVADLSLILAGGHNMGVNNVALDATQTQNNSYSVVDLTT